MSKVDRLLEKLDKVKATGKDQWVACCPAHGDKHPSLSIREVDDGRVLIHCFAGCDPLSVLGAVGLSFEDVMPERLGEFKPIRRRFNPATINECNAFNAQVIAMMAKRVALGETLTLEEAEKMSEMAFEMQAAVDYAST